MKMVRMGIMLGASGSSIVTNNSQRLLEGSSHHDYLIPCILFCVANYFCNLRIMKLWPDFYNAWVLFKFWIWCETISPPLPVIQTITIPQWRAIGWWEGISPQKSMLADQALVSYKYISSLQLIYFNIMKEIKNWYLFYVILCHN